MIILVCTLVFSTPVLKQHEGTTVLCSRRLKTVIGTYGGRSGTQLTTLTAVTGQTFLEAQSQGVKKKSVLFVASGPLFICFYHVT